MIKPGDTVRVINGAMMGTSGAVIKREGNNIQVECIQDDNYIGGVVYWVPVMDVTTICQLCGKRGGKQYPSPEDGMLCKRCNDGRIESDERGYGENCDDL